MASQYNHSAIEKKWRENWEKNPINVNDGKKEKYYCLDMFPYPSGNGLHVGHWRGYVISDVWSRYQLLKGKYVIHPMGWDAFGLPAENYAIKMGVHPAKSTAANIANIKRQIKQIAAIYDWDMEVNTTDPEFYKWTQWIFVQMFKKGLAYEKEFPINWCPSCKTGLANEEVVNGCCERCGTPVTKKNLRQWMLKITAYAERLLNDLDKLDWPEKVKKMQTDWIGNLMVQRLSSQSKAEMKKSLFTPQDLIPCMVQPSWYWLQSTSWLRALLQMRPEKKLRSTSSILPCVLT